MGGAWASPRQSPLRVRSARAAVVLMLACGVALPHSSALAGGVEPRVVNGSLATQAGYPYVAGILTAGVADPFAAQFCGGAVVASRVVITAAHCVDTHPVIDVLVNTDRLESGYGDRIPVTSIRVHPRWDPVTTRNDLALLYLASPSHAERIQVIRAASDFRAAPHEAARVAGYGCVEYDISVGTCNGYPDRLYKTVLPILTDSDCGSILGADYHAGTMRCAGSTSAAGLAPDACFGDSGGPLVVRGPTGSRRAFLIGLVSWGPGCGTAPSAYTRLSSYRAWLKENGVPMRGPFRRGPHVSKNGDSEPLSGDFDGDGRHDVLWHTPGSSPDVLWRGTGGGFERAGSFAFGDRGVPVVGDFDGDGRDDILWYGRGARRDRLSLGTAGGFESGPGVDVGGRFRPVAGDFDGDGRDDVFWYGPGDRTDVVWRGRTSGFAAEAALARSGDYEPVSGDFDGDGRDDILWFDSGRPGDPVWRGTATGFGFGPEKSIEGRYSPSVGDYDGDGKDDVFWHHPGDGRNLVWRGSAGGFTLFDDVHREGADGAVSGDFDGDGRDDVLVYGSGEGPDALLRGNRR